MAKATKCTHVWTAIRWRELVDHAGAEATIECDRCKQIDRVTVPYGILIRALRGKAKDDARNHR